jgi:hypothetical protein
MGKASLQARVERVAEALLVEHRCVAPIDVLQGLGWLAAPRVDEWRQGRLPCLERGVEAGLGKISTAMRHLRWWADSRGLVASETAYVARTRDRRKLRFSVSGDPGIERAYRTHWVSPSLSAAERERLAERQSRPADLVVVLPRNEWECAQCSGTGELLIMDREGPLCLACADLDHLVFLAAGDAALTRRAKRASRLSAVVVRYSQTRKRYERQGILVDQEALEQAEAACLADEDQRARRRVRDAERRAASDVDYERRLTQAITELFPGCPPGRADAIAAHAAQRSSGRVGRSAAAKALDPEAVTLAVIASVRHRDTDYDQLLMSGAARDEARAAVRSAVDDVLDGWRRGTRPR